MHHNYRLMTVLNFSGKQGDFVCVNSKGQRRNHLVARKNSKQSSGNCHDACNLNNSFIKDIMV